ncbi:MAG: hypothetical protein SF182_11735, partial [Deltaproteobacteria bacterium]|nr:hypothetical protein [Deltaproteobacteria bacterium]
MLCLLALGLAAGPARADQGQSMLANWGDFGAATPCLRAVAAAAAQCGLAAGAAERDCALAAP